MAFTSQRLGAPLGSVGMPMPQPMTLASQPMTIASQPMTMPFTTQVMSAAPVMAPRIVTQAPTVVTSPVMVTGAVAAPRAIPNLLSMGNVVSERRITLEELAQQGRFGVMSPEGVVEAPNMHEIQMVEAQERGVIESNPVFDQLWPEYEAKMLAGGPESSSQAAIQAFQYNFHVLTSGASTMIPESDLDPVPPLPDYMDLNIQPNPDLLRETVVLKLNGGLGTGMGLDKAKSLLTVTQDARTGEDLTFLDLIAKQVAYMKQAYNMPDLKFMLMNSFATSQDTLDKLAKYPFLGTAGDLEFVQNKAPKVTAEDYTPAYWPADREHEWCPPGHGDLYPAMLGSGTLTKLLAQGYRYMFVSNSDNLGATMDLNILTYFVSTGAPFLMEVAARTDADKKGGHLGLLKDGRGLTLRESAQCPKEDEKAFQDTSRYTYFNTNNLWVDLVQLQAAFDTHGGLLPLPVMKNDKTVDPRDKKSTKVIQLETAMGAAISCFDNATALLIPRSRFAPVKKCDDLIALRSDAYVLTEDYRIELAPERGGVPPTVKLDDLYKFADAMETLIPEGAPSLIECTSLKVEGPMAFAQGVVIRGDVKFVNAGSDRKLVPAGVYENNSYEL